MLAGCTTGRSKGAVCIPALERGSGIQNLFQQSADPSVRTPNQHVRSYCFLLSDTEFLYRTLGLVDPELFKSAHGPGTF
eukprot:2665855-Rhodomonas_salina.2